MRYRLIEFTGVVPYPASWPPFRNGNIQCDMLQGPCACGATHSIEEWDLKKTVGQKIADRLRVFSEDLEAQAKETPEKQQHWFRKLQEHMNSLDDADGQPIEVAIEYNYMGSWVTVRDFGPGWCAIEGRFGDLGECHPNDLKRKK